MSVGVGSGLVGRVEVAHGSLSINEETTSHLPNIKEVHAKSCHAFKVGSSNSRMKENEELLFWWFLGHVGSLGGGSTRVCGRRQKTKMRVHGAFWWWRLGRDEGGWPSKCRRWAERDLQRWEWGSTGGALVLEGECEGVFLRGRGG
ncbi:hypothetical protein ACSQ67_003616 [Phaseolus vulgaris]